MRCAQYHAGVKNPILAAVHSAGRSIPCAHSEEFSKMAAGTRREIVQRLNQEFGKLLADQSFREKIMLPSGLEPDEPNSPEAFTAFIKRDRDMYEKLIKSTGLKGD